MIKRSIISLIILLIGYNFLTKKIHWPSKSLSQWEDNERMISKFLYTHDRSKINTVIVGSSMSFRMTINQNPIDSIYNLSLGGLGLFEGLEILRKSKYIPKYLFIETNIIYRAPRDNYAASFFTPGLYFLKRQFHGFRQEYRPITFLQYLFWGVRGKIAKYTLSDSSSKEVDVEPVNTNKNKRSDLVKEKRSKDILRSYDKILQETDWDKIMADLNDYIHYFGKKGVSIVFIEMTTEKGLLESRLNAKIRELIDENFPTAIFLKAKSQNTTDGVHLKPEDASDFLFQTLKGLGRKKTLKN